MRVLACVFLVGCSSTTIVQVAADDAGPSLVVEPDEDAGPSPSIDAGNEEIAPDAAPDAAKPETSPPCPSYGSPDAGPTDVIYLLDDTCPTSCGPGPYRYETFANGKPSTAGTCANLKGTTEYCCTDLVCGRRPNLDQFCTLYNPGFGKGYNCDAPQGQPLPTRPNCQHYAHPQAGAAEFCCPD